MLPFHRFRRADGTGVDSLLSPEMKSTGEVMGIDADFGRAFAKVADRRRGSPARPRRGVRVGGQQRQARALLFPVKRPADLGFGSSPPREPRTCCGATGSPAPGCASTPTRRWRRGRSIVDQIRDGEVAMVINTPFGNSGPRIDGYEIRNGRGQRDDSVHHHRSGASAAVQGIEALLTGNLGVKSLQHLHAALVNDPEVSAVTEAGGFADRYRAAVAARGRLCAGIDPIPNCSSNGAAGVGAGRRAVR